MSLINDALKRARQSQRQDPPVGAPLLPPVQPAQNGGIGWFLPAFVVVLIATAAFFIGLAFARHKPPASASTEASMTQQTKPVPTVAPAASKAPASTAAANVQVAGTPPVPSGLKLQGIVYDLKKPWAIMNGQTIHVGDRVGGFHVKTISKSAVTLAGADGTEISIGLGK